jgi:carbon monoxide dehydrogenase subunit G
MSIVVARAFAVAAPAPAVREYLLDLGHAGEWDPATRHVTRDDAGPVAVGSSWHSVAKVLALTTELRYTLAEAGPDRLAFHGRGEGATATVTFTVRPATPGTEVGYHVDLEMHGVAKLATPVMKIEFEKLATEATGRLAGILNRLAAQAR